MLTKEQQVTKDLLATSVGSGVVKVYATPSMIAFMESICNELGQQYCQADEISVGIEVDVKHLRAVVENEIVKGQAELKHQENNILTFRVKVFHQDKLIGDGLMKRAIVNKKQFETKVGL